MVNGARKRAALSLKYTVKDRLTIHRCHSGPDSHKDKKCEAG